VRRSTTPVALLLAVLALGACRDDLTTYPLKGRHYDEAADCLEENGLIDVIEGEAEGTCEGVRCIRSLETGDHYVTAQCEAPPGYEDLTDAAEGPCALALAAHDRGDAGACPEDG
jgi:hypothetical protein